MHIQLQPLSAEMAERIRELCAPLDVSNLTHGWVNNYGDGCVALSPEGIRALPDWARKVFLCSHNRSTITTPSTDVVVGVAHGGAGNFEARDRLIQAANACLYPGSTPGFRERF